MPQVVCVEGPAPGYLLVAGPVLHEGPQPIDGVHSLRMDHLAAVSQLPLFPLFSALEPMLCFLVRHTSRWPRLGLCV